MTDNRMTRAELIRWLGEAIQSETSKPFEEIDYDFVEECGCLLDELMGKATEISDEEIAERLAKLNADSIEKDKSVGTTVSHNTHRKPCLRRVLAASVAAALILCGAVTAYAVFPSLQEIVLSLIKTGTGSSVTKDGVTYVYAGETITYRSIDDLIANETLDILFPHYLPDELKINTIVSSGEGYTISFVDNLASIDIVSGEIDTAKLSQKCKLYQNPNGIVTYILSKDKIFMSTTVHNGYTYYITTYDESQMTSILDNLH